MPQPKVKFEQDTGTEDSNLEVSIVGKKIREFRVKKGLTINELAEAIGVNPSAV